MSFNIDFQNLETNVRQQIISSFERVADSVKRSIATDKIIYSAGKEFISYLVPIKHAQEPTAEELLNGIDIYLAYLKFSNTETLPSDIYFIRISTPGYSFNNTVVDVSFVNIDGKLVYKLKGSASKLHEVLPKDAEFQAFTTGKTEREVEICGRRKCFYIKRNGFLSWEFGCRDTNGNEVSCI
ncbi:MAG: hypothetical protein JNN15_11200 [Blastocatellia bacterium]|nr:hypothetical protein [Blastocatellia bacterium]